MVIRWRRLSQSAVAEKAGSARAHVSLRLRTLALCCCSEGLLANCEGNAGCGGAHGRGRLIDVRELRRSGCQPPRFRRRDVVVGGAAARILEGILLAGLSLC